jgi:hypothetical protein
MALSCQRARAECCPGASAAGRSSLSRAHPMGNATRELEATVDQTDIRGLGTAFELFVAGLIDGDRHEDAHRALPRFPQTALACRVADRVCGMDGSGASLCAS